MKNKLDKTEYSNFTEAEIQSMIATAIHNYTEMKTKTEVGATQAQEIREFSVYCYTRLKTTINNVRGMSLEEISKRFHDTQNELDKIDDDKNDNTGN